MKRLCYARTRAGGLCRQPAVPESLRCRFHGGLAGRPPGTPMHPNTAAALKAGYERWLQRIRLAKQQGVIEKFPTGRRPRGAPKLHPDRWIRKAQRIIEGLMAKEASLRVVPEDLDIEVPDAVPAELGVATAVAADAAPASEADEAERLLADFVVALLDAPGLSSQSSSLWEDVTARLPEELYDRLDRWFEVNVIAPTHDG